MSNWHYALALKQELERAEETITGWILEDLGLFKMELPLGAGTERKEADLSPHQFTQLVAAAEETESVPALINYLRYRRRARAGGTPTWAGRSSQNWRAMYARTHIAPPGVQWSGCEAGRRRRRRRRSGRRGSN